MPLRLGPRPLPLHLGVEAWIAQLSFAALTLSSAGLRNSKLPLTNLPPLGLPPLGLPHLGLPALDLLSRALREGQPDADPAQIDPVQLVNAVAAAAKARMEGFVRGVARYQDAPVPNRPIPPAPIWTQGAASLRFYGGTKTPVLVVPSLINRATVLDLSPDRSFLRALAQEDIATYLLDWGAPGPEELTYDVGAYIARVLLPALHAVAMRERAPVHLAGYCLGGTLSMAPAVLAPSHVAGLILLAAPWDFHADNAPSRAMMTNMRPLLEMMLAANNGAPVDLLQALFASLDPSLVGRKFRAFADLAPASEEAKRFVALEDWLNDGVPLSAGVARQCLFEWYGANAPLLKQWRVGDTVIDPAKVAVPALVMIPSQDRIVPPRSAAALADALPNAEAIQVPLGHIGMMAGGGAPKVTFAPVVRWLQNR